VQDANIINDHAFMYEVKVDLDMLVTLMLDGVGGEIDEADIIKVDEGALRQWSIELLK
jgi:hypothetical protein